jgi:hypothetical protein
MKKFTVLLAGLSIVALTGCVSQEQADAKMKKGCQSAIGAMIAPTTIKDVKSSTAAPEKMLSSTYRRVTLKYIEEGDFSETEVEGSCLFSEQWGMMKSTHAAMLEQVVFNGNMIGKDKDGNIQGDMNDFMKLNEKVDAAMAEQ